MKVIIVGDNIADIVTARNSDLDKHFIKIRKQLYKLYPEQFYRCRIIKKGVERDSEEVSCFMENSIHPFHSNGVRFDQDSILAEIWEHKCTSNSGIFHRFKGYMTDAGRWGRTIYPYIGLIIGGMIVAWALLSNGGVQF